MTRGTGVVLGAMCLVVLAGCKDDKDACRVAATHYLQVRPGLEVDGTWLTTVTELAGYCDDTQGLASQAGCGAAYSAFRACLEGVTEAGASSWVDFCVHEVAALEACLAGAAHELECDDMEDGDQDGQFDCNDPDCANAGPCQEDPWPPYLSQNAGRTVDLLFVIDNSGSMAGEQANLRANFGALMSELRNTAVGLPNLHVGVTSTDLGTGAFQITYCDEPGGDAGRLLTSGCTNPTGAPYIIDVGAEGCEITRETNGTCSAHTCSAANCVDEPNASFVVDSATGCPRCRNYSGESLEEVFSCIADLGTFGCGFEQPLEAMYQALDFANTANTGFVREEAILAVVLVTDEDDCSASTPLIFDTSQTTLDSPLGPLSSYRCFEFGTHCDVNDREQVGTRHNCVPRTDADALLHPLSRYTQFLQALKDRQMLVLGAIGGPVTPSGSGDGLDVEVARDASDYPEVQFSCDTTVDGAVPGVRLHHLVSTFNEPEDMALWAYSSICAADYTPTLVGVGQKIKVALSAQCLPAPLLGCADVGVEFGVPQAPQTCAVNAQCLATCQVTDIFERGLPTESEQAVPPCLEVMPDGSLASGNTDRSVAYANGHPPLRDPSLPVSACWHIAYNDACPRSRYSELLIARQEDPPPRSFAEVACMPVPLEELTCGDGEDNDQDCLIDGDDPCCQDPANCVL